MCKCVCVCVCVCVYAYMYTYTHGCTYVFTYGCMDVGVYEYTNTRTHNHTYEYIPRCGQTWKRSCCGRGLPWGGVLQCPAARGGLANCPAPRPCAAAPQRPPIVTEVSHGLSDYRDRGVSLPTEQRCLTPDPRHHQGRPPHPAPAPPLHERHRHRPCVHVCGLLHSRLHPPSIALPRPC